MAEREVLDADTIAARTQFIGMLALKMKQYPQLRIGQLFCNLFKNPDRMYYVSDRELTTELARYNP